MAINKVTKDGAALIDLSTDTVTSAADIAIGKVGHLNDGTVVTGTHSGSKPEQSKTLTLGASAPSTVTPDSGKVLTSVPVALDTSVIKAENIAKDVTILGITGTHEGGGGGTRKIRIKTEFWTDDNDDALGDVYIKFGNSNLDYPKSASDFDFHAYVNGTDYGSTHSSKVTETGAAYEAEATYMFMWGTSRYMDFDTISADGYPLTYKTGSYTSVWTLPNSHGGTNTRRFHREGGLGTDVQITLNYFQGSYD